MSKRRGMHRQTQVHQVTKNMLKDLTMRLVEIQKHDYYGESKGADQFRIALKAKIDLRPELCKEISVETFEFGEYWKNLIPEDAREVLVQSFIDAFVEVHNNFSKAQNKATQQTQQKISAPHS